MLTPLVTLLPLRVPLYGLQLRDWDAKTGMLTSAQQAVRQVADNERVQHVVTNVSKGVAASW